MKWIFYVVVFIYMFYKAVYGLQGKDGNSVTIEPVEYDADKNFLLPGTRKSISCKGATKNQKVEWLDPRGNIVKRVPTSRVFMQEHFVSSLRTRTPAMVLVFTRTAVTDTGVWECRSSGAKQNVSLCVIDPSQFVDTPTEVTVDRGRSITLSCQARGEPEPRVLWYRSGEVITDDADSYKYQVMTKYNSQGFEGLLTITSLDHEDTGTYTCDAIQESPFVDDCNHRQSLNISLLVNHAPMFLDANNTEYVYGTEGESVDLTCSASGYPVPAYRWFMEVGNTLSEFGKEKIQLLEDGAKAVLSIAANASTLGQRYNCRATNLYGDADKTFVLLKTEKPRKPSEVVALSSTEEAIQLRVNWFDEMFFPVTGVKVQYLKLSSLKRKGVPREGDWKRSEEADLTPDPASDSEGFTVGVPNLGEETVYWIRLRAANDIGESPWSEPVLASTIAETELPEEELAEVEEEPTTAAPIAAQPYSDTTFYGVFFAGGIIIIAVACMFAMRMV